MGCSASKKRKENPEPAPNPEPDEQHVKTVTSERVAVKNW